MPYSFTASHIKRLVDSRKAHTSGIDPLNLSKDNYSLSQVHDGVRYFEQSTNSDSDKYEWDVQKQEVITSKLIIPFYSSALETCLKQAIDLDKESGWWSDVESSRWSTAMYFLQTLPIRIIDVLKHIIRLFRESGPQHISVQSVKEFLVTTVHPTTVKSIIYPHMQNMRRPSMFKLNSPLDWTRQECIYKRKELEKLRDDRAEILGELTELRESIDLLLLSNEVGEAPTLDEKLNWIMLRISSTLLQSESLVELSTLDSRVVNMELQTIASNSLHSIDSITTLHNIQLGGLSRPNRIVLLWPKIVFLPTATLWLARYLYASRENIWQTLGDIQETLIGFWNGWVIGPVREILNTVRTGGDAGMTVVSKDSLQADMASLERMALSLSADKLKYNEIQLAKLSSKIREGDLTPILKIYEEDIKSPLKSAFTGSLVRSLLIQVQKTKVDVDLAMSGIDKLLKSQELTFGFVGVAPALAIVYLAAGWLRGVLFGRREMYGSKKTKANVVTNIRRIERLLTSSNHSTPERTLRLRSQTFELRSSNGPSNLSAETADLLPPKTNGLIILSLTHLRSYAMRHLPARSKIREGFLEDVSDLENPELGREAKRRVIERMWRCWGTQLGWYSLH